MVVGGGWGGCLLGGGLELVVSDGTRKLECEVMNCGG